jgi:hypothetical protein
MGTVQLTAVPVQLAYTVNVDSLLIATVYPVITEPPSTGATQVIVTLVPETAVVGAAGTMGTVGKTAPLPDEDVDELPMAFLANTVAETPAPFARL